MNAGFPLNPSSRAISERISYLLFRIFGNGQALGLDDLNIEVEYQDTTIGKFGLDFDGTNFLLTTKQTDCLAKSYCEIPNNKQNKEQSNLLLPTPCC